LLRPVVIALIAGLAACESSGVADELADYRWRVGNVLDVRVIPEATDVPAYPRRRVRLIDYPDLRLSPGEALSLRACLGRLLGERNSILGQVMAPSTRFSYETRVAASLPACETDSDAGRALLDQVMAVKADSLAVAAYHLVFNSEEVEAFLSRAAEPAAMEELQRGLAGVTALDALVGWVDRGLMGEVVPERALSATLQRLRESRGAGGLLRLAALLTTELRAVAAMIHQRLDARPVCLQPQPTPTAQVAETVFHKFYADALQPDLTIVRRELSRLVTALSDAQHVQRSALPAELRGYLDAIRALDADLVSASTEHAQAWQRLLGQCGRMPDRGDRDSAA